MTNITVGDVITTLLPSAKRAHDWTSSWTIPSRTELVVTRVFSGTLLARGPIGYSGRDASVRLWKTDVHTINGTRVPDAPRPLGEKPDDSTLIGVDHPGIQWLFKDMARLADEHDWCAEYDDLCRTLGIPGRGTEFEFDQEIKTENGDAHVSFTARGQTRDDAIKNVANALLGLVP